MTSLPDRAPWTQPNPGWDLFQWEKAMREALNTSPFGDLMYDLPKKIYDLMSGTLIKQPEGDVATISQASQVKRRIFVRLMQDLRSVQMLTVSGYVAGAGTVASSISEIAFEVAWIGVNEERAQSWLQHTKHNKPVEAFGTRWKEVLAQRHMDEEERHRAETLEAEVYRSLCMLKHGNSIVQQGLGSFVGSGVMYFGSIPTLNANTLHAAIFVMVHTCRLCLSSTMDFINLTRPGTAEEVEALVAQAGALTSQLRQVHMAAYHQVQLLEYVEAREDKAQIARDTATRAVNTSRLATWEQDDISSKQFGKDNRRFLGL